MKNDRQGVFGYRARTKTWRCFLGMCTIPKSAARFGTNSIPVLEFFGKFAKYLNIPPPDTLVSYSSTTSIPVPGDLRKYLNTGTRDTSVSSVRYLGAPTPPTKHTLCPAPLPRPLQHSVLSREWIQFYKHCTVHSDLNATLIPRFRPRNGRAILSYSDTVNSSSKRAKGTGR